MTPRRVTLYCCQCGPCSTFTAALEAHVKARRRGPAAARATFTALQAAALLVDEYHGLSENSDKRIVQ
jgi:hypothetical protein